MSLGISSCRAPSSALRPTRSASPPSPVPRESGCSVEEAMSPALSPARGFSGSRSRCRIRPGVSPTRTRREAASLSGPTPCARPSLREDAGQLVPGISHSKAAPSSRPRSVATSTPSRYWRGHFRPATFRRSDSDERALAEDADEIPLDRCQPLPGAARRAQPSLASHQLAHARAHAGHPSVSPRCEHGRVRNDYRPHSVAPGIAFGLLARVNERGRSAPCRRTRSQAQPAVGGSTRRSS